MLHKRQVGVTPQFTTRDNVNAGNIAEHIARLFVITTITPNPQLRVRFELLELFNDCYDRSDVSARPAAD